MRKGILIALLILTVTAFVGTGVSLASGMGEETVDVKLSAFPNVATSAGGSATFTLGKDGGSIRYRLDLDGIENVTMAHVHAVGEGGKPGPVIVWLYPSAGGGPSLKEGKFSGVIAEGEITSDKLAGDWKGKPVKDLFEEIEYGKAMVAVHTKQNPGTEIWGVHKEEGHGMMEKKKM